MKVFGDDSSVESIEIHRLRALVGFAPKGGWIELMSFYRNDLGFISGRGRPNAKLLSESIVGRAGHSSWKTFRKKELGISEPKWKRMSFADKYVVEHQYLSQLQPEPELIEKVALHCGEGMFPDNESSFAEAYREIKLKQQSQHKSSLKAAEERNKFLQDQQAKSEKENQNLISKNETLKASLSSLEQELSAKDTKLEKCNGKLAHSEKVIRELYSFTKLMEKPINTLYELHDSEIKLGFWGFICRPPLDHAKKLKDIGEKFNFVRKNIKNTVRRYKANISDIAE